MNMKRYIYITSLFIALVVSGCSNDNIPASEEQGLPIAGVILSMEGAGMTTNNVITRGIVTYSVNSLKDPTKTDLTSRSGWLLDFALYNGEAEYGAGSFKGGTYDASTYTLTGPEAGPEVKTYYFPNYFSPGIELLLYPSAKKDGKDAIAINQSTDLLSEDVLMQINKNGKRPLITPAHIIINDKTNNSAESIHLIHKHAMLDFAITNINITDIETVEVAITNKEGATTSYKPYEITDLTDYKEYMLILPEGTDVNPIIKVTTKSESGDKFDAIRYEQELKVISRSVTSLGSNNCYCFTLKGKPLELSPITIVDWARGEALQGEYIAVTAYPTFKAKGYANKTFYFYYDNKLTENGKAKLQRITFNQDAECTIKPDGRILTHIFSDESGTPSESNGLQMPITLGTMIIDLISVMPVIP